MPAKKVIITKKQATTATFIGRSGGRLFALLENNKWGWVGTYRIRKRGTRLRDPLWGDVHRAQVLRVRLHNGDCVLATRLSPQHVISVD